MTPGLNPLVDTVTTAAYMPPLGCVHFPLSRCVQLLVEITVMSIYNYSGPRKLVVQDLANRAVSGPKGLALVTA